MDRHACVLLLVLVSLAVAHIEARSKSSPGASAPARSKGPRDIRQCSCRKTCNPNNDICYSRSLCWACYLNGTTAASSGESLAPSAGSAGFIFSSDLAARNCNCRRVCSSSDRHCYNTEACSNCQQVMAPAAAVRKSSKCNCRKSCNPERNNSCFDEDNCYECVMGRAEPPSSN